MLIDLKNKVGKMVTETRVILHREIFLRQKIPRYFSVSVSLDTDLKTEMKEEST